MNRLPISFFKKLWFLPVLVIYVLSYCQSLLFVYIEGDDASSIAYHLLGRNLELQQPYSPYQGMMDVVLSILPPQEQILRVIAIGLTTLACISFGFLLLKLVFEWNNAISQREKFMAALFVILAAPELVYLGLNFMPTMVAISLVIISHLIIRNVKLAEMTRKKERLEIIISLLLFGVGVAFRWNTIVYGAVILSDIYFRPDFWPDKRGKNVFTIIWGVSAFILSSISILLSNIYTLDLSHAYATMSSVLTQVGTEGTNAFLSMILILTPLLTPAMVVFSLIGLVILLRQRNILWVTVLVGLLGSLPWIRTGTPKNIITFIPGLVFCFTVGILAVWNSSGPQWKKNLYRGIILVLLLLPWIIGVRVEKGDTAWGPGFEQKPFDRPISEGLRISLTLGSGSAFPTPESPRPIYGYLNNLFSGILRSYELKISNDRSKVVDNALTKDIPVLITSWSPDYFVDDLYVRGFTTSDPANKLSTIGEYFTERHFKNATGLSVVLFYRELIDQSPEEMVQSLNSLKDVSNQVILVGYPGSMRSLYLFCPEAMDAIGTTSAMLDLSKLSIDKCNSGK